MKTYERIFQTNIDVDSYRDCVQAVIDRIENDTINVYRPDDEEALCPVMDDDGATRVDARALTPVSIREWLPVVCQFIRWNGPLDEQSSRSGKRGGVVAWYQSNALSVLWPPGDAAPAGPGALIAGIVLIPERCVDYADADAPCDRLMCVVAHELVHAFNAMRWVVPAFMDWDSFYSKVLQEGALCDTLAICGGWRSLFVDDYGSDTELAEIQTYWPSQAERWFTAFRGYRPGQSASSRETT